MKSNAIVINAMDNVAVVLEDVKQGQEILLPDDRRLTALMDIISSHKVLLTDLARGGEVIKYGEVIGRVNTDLKKGDWVHSHNLMTD